ncbi:hypothetical protein GCM10027062_25310 [Nocardioides hungaricus]
MRLLPGLHVTRRDDRHLQVGVDPPWRAVLPDHPDVRRLLDDLAAGRSPTPTSPPARRALADLTSAGLLVAPPRPRGAVTLVGSGAPEVERLLRESGCTVGPGAEVAVLAVAGEVPRSDADAEACAGRPHLVLGAHAHGWTVGPFVVPGRTACLRCVDAHHGEQDPRRALVVEQLAGLPAAPADPALATMAAAWTVRDLLTFLDGGEPATWSATVELGPALPPRRRAWERHPHCGCSWAQ